jgi:hypothetical protein
MAPLIAGAAAALLRASGLATPVCVPQLFFW